MVSVNPPSHDGTASVTIPDFGQGSLSSVLNVENSKINITSPSPKESGGERSRTKYTPLGDKNCNLLNANLFLSDSYINYLSDRSLDCTNACLCHVGDRKLALRHLSLVKEPIGYARNIGVCSCGLWTFEMEKLKEHEGLFFADIQSVSRSMDDLGVTLDERYLDKGSKNSASDAVKKDLPKKEFDDVKCRESADLLGTSNSACLVECLLDQFSSPLSAAATSKKLSLTDVNSEETDKPRWLKSGKTC